MITRYNGATAYKLTVRDIKELTNLLQQHIGKHKAGLLGIAPKVPAESDARSFMAKPELNQAMQDLTRRAQLGRIGQGPMQSNVDLQFNTPTRDGVGNLTNPSKLASNGTNELTGNYGVELNPNMDEVIAAHELGHIINRQGKFGGAVRDLRNAIQSNPHLGQALMAAGVLGGGGYAMLNEGNDDIDEALAISLLATAPTLLDEGMASMTGLDLMNRAGSRASLGQRGRLAGGFLSYMAPAVVAGLGAAGVGNMLD